MIARIKLLLAIVLTFLVVFTGRLLYLQVVKAEELSALSEENSLERQHISPLRGRILARDGTVLADNRVASDLMYWGGEVEHWDRLKFLLELEDGALREPNWAIPEERLGGAVAAWNIPDRLIPAVEELVAGQSNLYLRDRIERTYPTNLAAQVVGYTTHADPDRFPGYQLNDLVGVMGLEQSHQETLFGTPGVKLVQRDNARTELSSQVIESALPGTDITLTIDPEVQSLAEEALRGALTYVNQERTKSKLPLESSVRGAFIALNPKTGEILAMASAPSFDQNTFTKRPSDPQAVQALLNDTDSLPMSNRAVQAFPPASTFKLVSSSALLENGYLSPSTAYFCSASIRYGGIRWDNWSYPSARGTYTVRDAIADSCNTFYWQAALSTPSVTKGWAPYAQDLAERAFELGYGRPVGVGLEEEKPGRVATDEWSRNYHGWPWRSGDTLNVSIGQGDTLATPLQNAQALLYYIMDGEITKPHLVKEVGGASVEVATESVPGQYWHVIKDGMRHMITDYGTQYTLGPRAFPINVAGKTGTAQNAKGDGYDHTWFMAYGPIEDPEIAVVAFIEHGNKSTGVAVPTVRDFFAGYWHVEGEDAP